MCPQNTLNNQKQKQTATLTFPLFFSRQEKTKTTMSVIDILFRVDDICKKYDKYDIDKQRELNAYGDDGFARLYAAVDSTIQQALNVPFYSLFIFLHVFIFL